MNSSIEQLRVSTCRSLIYCVVLNWNGWQDTVECLRSLSRQTYPELRVIVVDNASTDDSIHRIKQASPDAEIVESNINGGFASGCNLGIQRALAAGAQFVWLLNNDTVVPPETLPLLLQGFDVPRVGIVGTVLRYAHDPDRVQAWGGGKMLLSMGYVRHYAAPAEFGPNSFLTFASVLINKRVFEQIGLLDEGYFMYFEDSDFCFRARRAGWELGIAPGTAVLHKEGGSIKQKRSLLKERIVTRSGLRFLSIHAPRPSLARTLFVLSKLLSRALRGDMAGVRAVLLGATDWHSGRTAPMRKGAQ